MPLCVCSLTAEASPPCCVCVQKVNHDIGARFLYAEGEDGRRLGEDEPVKQDNAIVKFTTAATSTETHVLTATAAAASKKHTKASNRAAAAASAAAAAAASDAAGGAGGGAGAGD